MAPPVTEIPDPALALARSTLYRFLSLGWSPPEDGLAALRTAPAVLEAVTAAAERMGGVRAQEQARRVVGVLTASAPAGLQAAYRRLFGHQISRDCPLHETQYGVGHIFQQAQQLADIAGFYLAFGLEVAAGAGERVDHLSLELEFLHVLAFREAHASVHEEAEKVWPFVDARRAFLRDHVARWVPTFTRLVTARDDGLYGELAHLTRAVITADAAALGIIVDGEDESALPVFGEPGEATPPCGADRCPLEPSP
ncbi:MAG: molecular chaperone TorD family protein [Armatimonadota bacterium]|nr:molecular chaperone TorD family protein [Armatimonadota bacterium]MDR7452578.1 molecular chaperone TorD family protein [Armatimonadota bacterium]MDR7468207.1 molecular chaperone TorD family protein [Armatimonadota bacterium]MDR7495067.1 molecular chaperone TorD family protein [Armatimonadota bacterium]MDR7500113.1 molecular chaperone TorD family protein [Armatimonadota bacterium]